ncbi:MAG TPA: hypothetical protein IAB38_05275 [Candidatus Onthousia excrementipullorum]|uniref:Uncharacterized protein n=1 Tax=Candidatus Onthousia excrementipullorum TaxID=2840884 RepID=A0A9D1DUM0_9FIRM|nr:hypothetical protein [Candidatus Onthousia excrementipullorum]
MKKVLLEYANVFAYTITGLIFGLAFFLLFINFYHMQELAETVDVSAYNDTNKASVEEKIETIRNNINVYNQSTYNGSLNIYGLNTVQLKLQDCLEIIESEDMMKYFELDEIGINDSYNFTVDFKNKILNDCLVMQVKSLFNTDTVATLPNFDTIKPYVELDLEALLDSTNYVQSNIENSDHYYFSTETNKANFFNLVDDSYSDIMNSYQNSLDLLVEVSNWYRDIVIGG